MEEKTYMEIYTETIAELKRIQKIWLSKNADFSKKEMDGMNRSLWEKLRIPHGRMPIRKTPMQKFGGDRDGESFRIVF